MGRGGAARRLVICGLLPWLACSTPPSVPAERPTIQSPPDTDPDTNGNVDVAAPSSKATPVADAAVSAPASLPPTASQRVPAEVAPPPAIPLASISVGAPDDGELRNGVPLPESGPGFRFNPRRPQDARFGTSELVDAIMHAAAALPPGPELIVNDLGLPQGGPIPQHGSHQAGRDVDILFFYRDTHGKPHRSIGVPVEPNMTGHDYGDLSDPKDDLLLRLDAGRTWRFVQALLTATGDDIQRIFIVEHVRAALLAEARKQKAGKALMDRFAAVACQPGTPHDDHMHVRLYCTPEDMADGCLDKPPTYPWRRKALSALGLEPALYRGRPDPVARAARTTTPEQARKRAGKMHRDVIAFLERRKGWLKRKGPARAYCR